MQGRAQQRSTTRRELVGVAEVAVRLKLTAERVRQLARSGQMPEAVGELGRRQIWDWRDVETWARSEGRLPESDQADGAVRQAAPSRRNQPPGALRLVVDELMKWGPRDGDICHVRVWSPPPGSEQPQVVLLGQLEDRTTSITNRVEQVIMIAAARYCGREWQRAQFYQYQPAGLHDDRDGFLHVVFSVRALKGRLQALLPGVRDAAKTLGAEVVEPDWRPVSVEDFVHLTGDSPRVWAAGTYTRALLAPADADGAAEIVWDPERAADLARLAAEVAGSGKTVAGLGVALSPAQRDAVAAVLHDAAARAYERALEDVSTQRADLAIVLHPPVLASQAMSVDRAGAAALDGIDLHLVWDALTVFRKSLIERRYDQTSKVLNRERSLLVEGCRGGWAQLHWADAGVEEIEPDRHGWGGPIALPADLVGAEPVPEAEATPARAVLLLNTLATFLAENWDGWSSHDRPLFTPSTPMPATGPLTRRYLDELDWFPVEDADPDRVRRMPDRKDVSRVAEDADGWLVVRLGRGLFASEWPVSGPRDEVLASCRIQADRPARHGNTPVFLTWPDGRLSPLPSAGRDSDSNTYAWGYSGGGPWNLILAVVDLLQRAVPAGELHGPTMLDVVQEMVASPRTPDWQVSDLIDKVRRRQPEAWHVCAGHDD
ncbi:MAG TPA: hypothetical protein VHO01_10955 [Jatrophihabitans sp.]|nr:hypothetical protein [Jatrophihabitans sp.]